MKKVAIVNRTNLKNYGSLLQCYALYEAVKDMGYRAEIIWEQGNISRNYDFRPAKLIKTAFKMVSHPALIGTTLQTIREIKAKPIDSEKMEKFDEFVEKYVTQKLYAPKALALVAQSSEYLKFICGSDQVWCSTTMYVDPLMYLRFAPREKRVAYAPSIGRDYIPNYNRRQMKKYISEIPFVSIREESGRKLIKELTGRDVPLVCDPTLLVRKDLWEELDNTGICPAKAYALFYFLDEPSVEIQGQLVHFVRENQLEAVSIGQKLTAASDSLSMLEPDCGPGEFLGLVKNAEIVITDSYHGMLFSMIFEKKFWSVGRKYQQYDQSSRQLTVLEKLDLTGRYIKSCKNISLSGIDYGKVNGILDDFRRFSLNYLQNAIEG